MILLLILSIVLAMVLIGVLFVHFAPVFGAASTGKSLSAITHSKNFNGKVFVNLIPTAVSTSDSENKTSMWDFFFPAKNKNPHVPLPSKELTKTLANDSFMWLGHSTLLAKTADIVMMTDPVFNRASPLPIFGKPFAMKHKPMIKTLPEVDIVLITHDHYDHLDYHAIKSLATRVKKFFVPLGVKAHLVKWGVSAQKITELDWYEEVTHKKISFTLTPSRHFSGRGLTNRNTTLWGSWVVKSPTVNIYFSGDGGYSPEFKKIGSKYGPFDIAFVENGAYNPAWSQIHMVPEESVQASIDVKAKVFIPIHWSKFDLALHKWDEPVIRAAKEAKKKKVTMATPLIGEVFTLKKLPQTTWWEKVE
jgi:L-ascorbate metabolism protein UlaG (beta-lactamase superfamily)